MIQNSQDKRYNSLFTFLDLDNFDIDQLNCLCKCSSFDENFLNNKVINYITKMKENDEKIKKQEELTRNLQIQFDEFKIQNKKMLDEVTSILSNLLIKQHNDIIESVNSIKNDQNKYQKDNIQKIDEMNKVFIDQGNSINEIKKQIEKIEKDENSKNEKLFKDHQNLLKEIIQQNEMIENNQNSEIERIFKEQQNSLNQIKQQIENNRNAKIEKLSEDQQVLLKQIKQLNDQIVENNKNSIIERIFKEQQNILNKVKTQNNQIINNQNSTMKKQFNYKVDIINESRKLTRAIVDEKLKLNMTELKKKLMITKKKTLKSSMNNKNQ